MHYPGSVYLNDQTGNFENRTPVLKNILDSFQPDLLLVCELENNDGANQILNNALQTEDNRYNKANFTPNQSSTDTSLQQLVFYNQHLMTLVDQSVITTTIRDINHYNFQLNTNAEEIHLHVFVGHLKSSTGTDNVNARYEMVQQFTNYLQQIPANSYVIFGGDFNLYRSSESGYQEILDPTNAIVLVDPINSPGTWSGNASFQNIHTQSPLTTNSHFRTSGGSWEGITGGMDDRFDFLMISQNMTNNGSLHYVTDTYASYGNNGNCYNLDINNTDCTGIYSQELRNSLHNMSDHLPVVMKLESNYTLSIEQNQLQNFIQFTSSNVANNEIHIKLSDNFLQTKYQIINQLGQIIKEGEFQNTDLSISISDWNNGLYYIKTERNNQPLKFIKI